MKNTTQQNNINNDFIEIYKNTINSSPLNNNLSYIAQQLNTFQKQDIDDNNVKNFIKIMLNVPYYENGKLVDNQRKFYILKEKLTTIIELLENEEIIKRLNEINIPNTTLKVKNKNLIDL